MPLCVTTTACNVLWGVDELSFATPALGGQGPGGSGGDGAGGAGGFGGAGGTGGGELDCAGEFGAPTPVLAVPGALLASPAITVGQQELYFSFRADQGADPEIRRTTRNGSEPFPLGEAVAELPPMCASPTDLFGFDISADGLRAYVGCGTANGETVVMLAARSAGGDLPFVQVGPMATAGGSPGVSANELQVYTTGKASDAPPLVAERGSRNDIFGLAVEVPGLAGLPLRTPAPTPDDLALFGYVMAATQIGYVARSDSQDSFGPFTPVVTSLLIAASPDVSADCRAVYFVGNEPGGQDPSVIYVIER